MPKQKHIHRYERAFLGRKGNYEVFRCNLSNCTHYLQKKLVKGKEALCNRCGNIMIMDARAMRLERPHCADCIKSKKQSVIHDVLLDFIEANDVSSNKKP